MKRANAWTDADVAILRECYALDGGGREAAIARLSHRTVSAISFKVWELKLSTRERKPQKPRAPKSVVFPDAKPKSDLRLGPCDRGDREMIRRRIPFFVVELARDLKRTPGAVTSELISLAKARFEPDPIAKISVARDDAEAVALGTDVRARKLKPPKPRHV